MSEKRGDVVYTPDWVARDMCESFTPRGRVLDPCKGKGVFLKYLPSHTRSCEITEGTDFFEWHEEVDWVVGNPPYSLTRKWFRHSMTIAEHLLYLVPLRNVFSGYGFLREIDDFGGIAAIRCYGTGGKLGFPMGNAVGAMHIVRNGMGPTWISHYGLGAWLTKPKSAPVAGDRQVALDWANERADAAGGYDHADRDAAPTRSRLSVRPGAVPAPERVEEAS